MNGFNLILFSQGRILSDQISYVYHSYFFEIEATDFNIADVIS